VFVSLTRVHTGDQPIENAAIAAEEMMRWFRDVEGFRGFMMISQEGTTIGLSFWDDRDSAVRNQLPRAQFIELISRVMDVEIEERSEYEVMFAELGPLGTDGTG
jgi:hypothetical protein